MKNKEIQKEIKILEEKSDTTQEWEIYEAREWAMRDYNAMMAEAEEREYIRRGGKNTVEART